VTTHGSSGVGTDGKSSSSRVTDESVAVDDVVHMRLSGGDPPPRRDVQTTTAGNLQKRG